MENPLNTPTELPSRVHVIGICGVATSALAIAFHKVGVKVTGSDKGFFPPVSTELEKHGISFYAGWHPEKINTEGRPDLIVAGGVGTSLSNPEIIYAKENNIPLLSFAEALEKYIIKDKSIVVTGTWGKTTTSALLSYIFIRANMNPSYFTGGLSLSHDTGAITDSEWSIVEGDEYQIAIWDKRPKFAVYKPTHLILTSVSWDHADLYPTERAYFETFENLVNTIPAEGALIVCNDDNGVKKVLDATQVKAITYGKTDVSDYSYNSTNVSKTGVEFIIKHKATNKEFTIVSPMFGRFNIENITGAFAMAHTIGISAEKIIEAIGLFQGIKRRFEKRFQKDITIFDCHAPTPEKVASVLESLREVYSEEKIVAIFEPNIGGRQRASATAYDNAFKAANAVIIPHLTTLKVADNSSENPMDGPELAVTIARSHPDVKYMEDDSKLVEFLHSTAKKGDVIVFLGSHGFRGMIEETIKMIKA